MVKEALATCLSKTPHSKEKETQERILQLIEEVEEVAVPIVNKARKNTHENVCYCLDILLETGRMACKMNDRFTKGEGILKKVIKVIPYIGYACMYLCFGLPVGLGVDGIFLSMYLVRMLVCKSCRYEPIQVCKAMRIEPLLPVALSNLAMFYGARQGRLKEAEMLYRELCVLTRHDIIFFAENTKQVLHVYTYICIIFYVYSIWI